jgi:ABC-type multidrug transport system ATPase subunit
VPSELFKQVHGVLDARELTETESPQVQLHVNKATESLPSLLGLLEKQKIKLEDIEMQPANLEDVFLALTGKELRD